MSINTTNTNDWPAMEEPKPTPSESASSGASNISAFASTLPDLSVIARLANEFFTALPGNRLPSAVPLPLNADASEAELGASPASPLTAGDIAPQIPTAVRPQETPSPSFYFLEAGRVAPWTSGLTFPTTGQMFSFPGLTGPQSPPGAPSASSQNAGVDHLRVLPTSPGSTTVLTSQIPTSAQPPAIPGSAASSLESERVPLPAERPPVLASGEIFAMPDVPDLSLPSGIPTTRPDQWDETYAATSSNPAQVTPAALDGSFPDGHPSSPWTSVLEFPAAETFSFPLIAELRPPAGSPAEPPSLPTEDDLRALPASLVGTTESVSHLPIAHPLPSGSPLNFLDAEPTIAEPKFPSGNQLFSLPAVPGFQSLPGTPAIPSLLPNTPGSTQPSEASAPPLARESVEVRGDAVPDLKLSRQLFDPHAIRRDFPILQEQIHGKPLIWLDNAATTQKPQAVIDRISSFYEHENSNIHRAAHTLAARATDAYESAREKVRRFLNAPSTREIVFVRGATEAINLAAHSWGKRYIGKDDEIVISWIEHHSNIVPWQMLCAEKGARLRVAPVDDDGQIILEQYERLLNPRTKLVSLTHVSNALGTILPVREMIRMAHRRGARVLIDGAQSVAHLRVDVQALDCDFYVFSGHKIFAPTGIGVLYGKPEVLAESQPWQGGGSMIVDVTFEKSVYQQPPARFEAGTGNIADAVGLGAALDYLDQVGLENITRYEHDLLLYAIQELRKIPGLRLIGTAREKAGVISFVLEGHRTEEVGTALDREGIAVRAGHHCAQPALRRFGLESTVRPSLALYNTHEDVDALVSAVRRLQMRPR